MAEDIDVEAMLEAPYKKDVSMDFNGVGGDVDDERSVCVCVLQRK